MFTEKQIAALKYLIYKAEVRDPRVKQIFGLLIDESKGLTEEVCLTLTEGADGYSAEEIDEIAHSQSQLVSANGTALISEVLQAMGSDFQISVHYGNFDPNRKKRPLDTSGMFSGYDRSQVDDPDLLKEGMPMRYTFWVAKGFYSRSARLVKATREMIENVDLNRPGLYKTLEAFQ